MSLRARLVLGTALIALVLVASAAVIARATRDHLVGQVDAQLQDIGPRLGGRPAPGRGGGAGEGLRLSAVYVGVVDAEGRLRTVEAPDLRGDAAPTPQLDPGDVADLRAGRTVTVGSDERGSRYRLRSPGRIGPAGLVTVVGLSLDDADEAVRRLVTVELVAVLAVLAVLAVVTWWVIRLGVRPVRRMTATASAIAGGDLSLRVAEGDPRTEAGALGVALNGMLTRIEEAFEQRSASDARLRRFVADASHELRTPITTIRGYAELHQAGALDDPEVRLEAMRRTEQEAVRMGRLVDDLLLLARLDEGRPPERAPVDLAELASDGVRDALARAPDRQIELERELDAGAVVAGDEDQLRQVAANLIGNALVHAPGATVRVAVRASTERVELEVSDDGPGMAPADAERALERFYRADPSRSRQLGGSGLGLAIVDATVRAHGGAVTISSAVGEGTTVTVALPVSPAACPGGGPDGS
jgi:two-component system OmpR family sensor kinase